MSKPNILIILADDLGVDVFRVNAKAHKVVAQVNGPTSVAGPVELPNFGRLLAAGVHFQHTWAHPVCTPTRASLWTGMQAWKTRLGFPSGGDDNIVSPAITGQPIQALAQSLVGYKCAMFGKWDLGAAKTPVDWGWHEFAGTFRGGVRQDGVLQYGFPRPPTPVTYARLKNPTNSSAPEKCAAAVAALEAQYDAQFLTNNPDLRNYIWEKDRVGADGKTQPPIGPGEREHIYLTEDQVGDAKRWIRARPSGEPWCVALNLIAPHDPFHVPPKHTFSPTTIKDPSNPTTQEMLVAMIEAVDYYLGDLFKAIAGQLENTVVIFAGDNGTQDFDPDRQNASVDEQLGDDKNTSAVGGVHVPMIIADGGLMQGKAACYMNLAPRSIPAPVHIIDVYNTVLDIGGVTTTPSTDSISIAPHLNENVRKPTRTHNFSQMYLRPAPGQPTPGIAASVADSAYQYKLTCEVLLDPNTSETVDRAGKPTSNLVFDYKFSFLAPDPEISGSYRDQLLGGLTPNADGTFTVNDLAYEDKILELYSVLARERPYDDPDSSFPVIKKSSFVFPSNLLNTPVLIENLATKRYLFSDGPNITRSRGAEGGWSASSGFASPKVVGADANYYNRALWIIRRQGQQFLIESLETKRYLFSPGAMLSRQRGGEAGWKASSGFESPAVLGTDANYYNRALWVIQPQGAAFLLANAKTKRYAFSDGPAMTGSRGAEGGWKASSGFESPTVVGADANYYNRALWSIKRA
ncbi:sulfatase-like hydrolase/transferase [Enhygromyxa salina]|uniref:Sulfatase n=1 Tax=Enhygromyxa salina TaxID=215803 RepID=A0A2S9YTN9_9BACT|nr:sulfatase-like hydrolase/transferase [Enhygromyxa salina]PRQ08454.1 Sulfatase [Enhygromyxa salina]